MHSLKTFIKKKNLKFPFRILVLTFTTDTCQAVSVNVSLEYRVFFSLPVRQDDLARGSVHLPASKYRLLINQIPLVDS